MSTVTHAYTDTMMFLFSFLGFSISLISWQLWIKHKKAYILGVTSLLFLMLTVLSVVVSGDFSISKIGVLAVSVLSLAVLSFIAMTIRKLPMLKIPFLAASMFAIFRILQFGTSSALEVEVYPISEVTAFEDGELLVQVAHDKKEEFRAFAQGLSTIDISEAFQPVYEDETILDDYFLVDIKKIGKKLTKNEIEETKLLIEQQPEVKFVEINETIQVPTPINIRNKSTKAKNRYLYMDPLSDDQWALAGTNMNEDFKIIKKNKPEHTARLFILDTGVDSSHPDLQEVFIPTKSSNDKDKRGHGTHCAGIASAMTGNNIGISSYNAEGIYSVSSIKVLADFGGGTQQGIIKGIIDAVDLGADVISMSLGGISNDARQKAYNDAIEYANRKNVIVVVAAGNSNRNAKGYSPANSKGVIAVAAIGEDMKRASFSNTLEDIEMGVSAPGVDILSTFPNGRYERFSGTSMATPYVAGFITLMKSYRPEITTQEAFQLLSDVGINSQDNQIKTIINPSASLVELLK